MCFFQHSLSQDMTSPFMPFHKPETFSISVTASSPCPQHSIHQQLYQVYLLIFIEYVTFSHLLGCHTITITISHLQQLSNWLPCIHHCHLSPIHFLPNIQSYPDKQKFNYVTVIYLKQLSDSSWLSWWRPKSLPRPTSSDLCLFLQLYFPLCPSLLYEL